MTQHRDWQKEAKIYKQSYDATLTAYEAEKARADAAKELLLDTIGTMMAYDVPAVHINRAVKQLSTLYPDTPAQSATPTARPIEEWHEDYGDVLWWTFPIEESPYCGSPLDEDWPGYHTHWTPIVIPAALAPKEGV